MDNMELEHKIEPIISSHLFKTFNEELQHLYILINTKHPEISIDELKSLYNLDASKLAVKLGIKKRVRKKIDKDKTCMGRKGDGFQCTRSRMTESEFCLSHKKNLPHGRIDDENYVPKPKGQRGRRRKDFELKNNIDYIPMLRTRIEGQYYLLDTMKNIYSNDEEHPKKLGKLLENNEIQFNEIQFNEIQ